MQGVSARFPGLVCVKGSNSIVVTVVHFIVVTSSIMSQYSSIYEQTELDMMNEDLEGLSPESMVDWDFVSQDWRKMYITNETRIEAGEDHIFTIPPVVHGFKAFKFKKWGVVPRPGGDILIFTDPKGRWNPVAVRKVQGRCIILNSEVKVLSTFKMELTTTFLSGEVAFAKTFDTREHWPVTKVRRTILQKLKAEGKATNTSEIHLIPDGATTPLRGNATLWPQVNSSGRSQVKKRPAAAGCANIRTMFERRK
jgi:hypothetical protein